MTYIVVCDYSIFRHELQYFRVPYLWMAKIICHWWCWHHPCGKAVAIKEIDFRNLCAEQEVKPPVLNHL